MPPSAGLPGSAKSGNQLLDMKKSPFFVAAVGCLLASCSTPDVNPRTPRANTGYVDFYTEGAGALSWEIKRAEPKTGTMRTVFCEYKPLPGNIVRLAAAEGNHRFELWCNNQVTTGPETVLVPVANGKVTPVRVTLTPAGSASVAIRTDEYRPTARATRRVTRIADQEQELFQLGLSAAPPQDYQPKERMAYFSLPAK